MVPSVRHFENLTLWILLCLGLRNRAWKATNGHSRKLAQLSATIFLMFWLQDCYPVCIHGSRPHCFTCITEQVTRKLLTCFLGVGGPWPVISWTRAWKLRNLSIRFRRQCFINPWIQTALFLIIAIATTSAAVIWQLLGKGGFCGFHFGWSFRFPDYILSLLTKYGVCNADKYFSRNK